MKNRFVRSMVLLTAVLMCMSSFAFSVGAATDKEFTYEVNDRGAVITAYNGTAKSVVIPEKLGGKSVVGIGDGVFMHMNELDTITIPDTVISVGKDAFYGTKFYNSQNNWTADKQLYLGDILLDVDYKARGDIRIKDGTRVIADFAVAYSKSIKTVTLPDSVEYIGKGAFEQCSKLTAINVNSANKSYTSQSGVLFDKKINTLVCYPAAKTGTTYEIPNTVKTIGESAFKGNDQLTKITVPKTVTVIGSFAFAYCEGLKSANLPEGLTVVPEGAFQNCSDLSAVVLPETTVEIGKNAFEWCSDLENIALPSKVKTIGDNAFYYCNGLIGVYLPKSIAEIGNSAFYGCKSLKTVNFAGTQAQFKAIDVDMHNLPFSETQVNYNSKGLVQVGSMLALSSGDTAIIGDVNDDEVISIKDATIIQKHLASIEILSGDNVLCADTNSDNNITIRDATYIQKKLAKLDY